VLGITTVHGIVGVDQVVANVSRCLRANHSKVPIYRGAAEPLVSRVAKFNSEYLFGKDGNSDQGDKNPKALPKDFENYDNKKPAAVALIDMLKCNSDVTLISIGPLTNIALAMRLCDDFVKLPKEMVIMGGNFYGIGNLGSNLTAEFNFGCDPEAAHVVLKEMLCPITIIPWEAAFLENDRINDANRQVDFHEHLNLLTTLSKYFNAISSKIQSVRARANRQYAFVDEIAIGTAIDRAKIIKTSRKFPVIVELTGSQTRGQIAVEWTNPSVCSQEVHQTKSREVEIVLSYNVPELNKMMFFVDEVSAHKSSVLTAKVHQHLNFKFRKLYCLVSVVDVILKAVIKTYPTMSAIKKLIIDTDGAADDIRAMSLALQTSNVQVMAITTVKGVVSVDQVVANVSRTLRANNAKVGFQTLYICMEWIRSKQMEEKAGMVNNMSFTKTLRKVADMVPIYKGAFEPLLATRSEVTDESFFFGKDGMGDRPNDFPQVTEDDANNFNPDIPASLALTKLFQQYDDVTLVCLGPLTNIALALKLDKDFASRPKEIYIMGGNLYGIGNVSSTTTSEFNFCGDPEAAHIVLSTMQCPITVIPWEAFFFESEKPHQEIDFHAHLELDTPLARYFSTVTNVGRKVLAKNGRQYAYCDEIAMASAIDAANVINESKYLRASVELSGNFTRGQVACDWTDKLFSADKLEHKIDRSRKPIRFVKSYNVAVIDAMITAAVKNCR
uniref:IU_nuc_hydro domain-containing protein n=1 Tax=Syphacia muris TaxID=451379 RepID=A0A0N5AAW8_9BILA